MEVLIGRIRDDQIETVIVSQADYTGLGKRCQEFTQTLQGEKKVSLSFQVLLKNLVLLNFVKFR